MVHALRQVRRVLRRGGTLIDIRPDRFRDPTRRRARLPRVGWRSGRGEVAAGRLDKTAANLRRHRAATRSLHEAVRRGEFVLATTETFTFRYYFRDLDALDAFLRTRWVSSILSKRVRSRLTALRRRAGGEIVVAEPVRLNVLRKA